jgi:hypothetical protein
MRIGLLAPERRYEDSFLTRSEPLFDASGANLGNFAFVEAIWRHLAPEVTIMPWGVAAGEARERADILVLAAANQLGAHNDLGEFATHLESIGLPLVVVGLGAQAESLHSPVNLPTGTERWARVLAALAPSSAPNIGLRGEFTARVMERLGLGDHAVVTGCPSNFLNDSPDFYATLKSRVEKRRIDRLCVAAGSPHFASVRHLEARLAQLVTATGGVYVAQADLDMVRFARGESEASAPEERERIHGFVAPHLSAPEVEIWRQRHAMCFSDATSWMEVMRSCDFAVGARFHGVMLAVQAGSPGGVIAHDSRTQELARTMALPARQAQDMPRDFDLADLGRLFAFDVGAYAATRERLRGVYVDLLRGCGLAPHERLTQAQAAA